MSGVSVILGRSLWSWSKWKAIFRNLASQSFFAKPRRKSPKTSKITKNVKNHQKRQKSPKTSKITKNVKNHEKCQKSRKITKIETRITKITQDQKSSKMSKMRSHNVRFVSVVAGILFPVKLRLVFSKNERSFVSLKYAKMTPISPLY